MSDYNVKTQMDGYPEGISTEDKEELEAMVKALLLNHGALSLYQIVEMVKDKASAVKKAVLVDFIYCAVDRAARAVSDPVFAIRDNITGEIQTKKEKTLRVKIVNEFHNTSTTTRTELNGKITKERVQAIRRRLCGVKGCSCGGELGERGSSELAAITDKEGAVFEFVPSYNGGGTFQYV